MRSDSAKYSDVTLQVYEFVMQPLSQSHFTAVFHNQTGIFFTYRRKPCTNLKSIVYYKRDFMNRDIGVLSE